MLLAVLQVVAGATPVTPPPPPRQAYATVRIMKAVKGTERAWWESPGKREKIIVDGPGRLILLRLVEHE